MSAATVTGSATAPIHSNTDEQSVLLSDTSGVTTDLTRKTRTSLVDVNGGESGVVAANGSPGGRLDSAGNVVFAMSRRGLPNEVNIGGGRPRSVAA
jgi:hypothetical protein